MPAPYLALLSRHLLMKRMKDETAKKVIAKASRAHKASKLSGKMTQKQEDEIIHSALYKEAKQKLDSIRRKAKRLEQAVRLEPDQIAPQGLKKMLDPTSGIPQVSKKMSNAKLIIAIKKIDELNSMETGNIRGARRVAKDVKRRIAGVDPDKRYLNKAERARLKQVENHIHNNPNFIGDFFTAFNYYKEQMAYKMLDSDQYLNEFRQFIEKSGGANLDLDVMYDNITRYANEQHEAELERRRTALPPGANLGGITWN